jgi:hypothetical protein
MIEDKLTKCKDKKECLEVIKEHLVSMFSESNNMKLDALLSNAILLYTSELLEGKRDPKSYNSAVDRVLGKYKECSKNPEKLSKIKEIRRGVLKAYSKIKDLPGECNYWDEIMKGVKDEQKKDEYVV